MADKKKQSLSAALVKEIFALDEATGLTNADVMAKQIVAIAKGDRGSAREIISAFQIAVDRVDGKVKEEIGALFWDSFPKAEQDIIDKYKTMHNFTYDDEIEKILSGAEKCPN